MNARRILGIIAVVGFSFAAIADDDAPLPSAEGFLAASDAKEARARAQMLHEMARGALQVMHRDFFDEENSHSIPSASLEDVFQEMHKSYEVKMKWLTVNTDVVNIDHQAETQFEKDAVKTLAAGKSFAELVTADRYEFAGPIRLGSQCLKCHVKRRTSNEDRTAGLIISMPLVAR